MQLTQWNDRLAFDLALALEGSGESVNEIAQRHNLASTTVLKYSKDPTFQKRITAYREDIRDKGLTFKLKARAQAEELLVTSWNLIHSNDVSAAVKADLIKSTVKWAGLEPKNEEGGNAPAGGVKININFGGNSAPMTLTADMEGEAIELPAE